MAILRAHMSERAQKRSVARNNNNKRTIHGLCTTFHCFSCLTATSSLILSINVVVPFFDDDLPKQYWASNNLVQLGTLRLSAAAAAAAAAASAVSVSLSLSSSVVVTVT
jgi:hypothetical protein